MALQTGIHCEAGSNTGRKIRATTAITYSSQSNMQHVAGRPRPLTCSTLISTRNTPERTSRSVSALYSASSATSSMCSTPPVLSLTLPCSCSPSALARRVEVEVAGAGRLPRAPTMARPRDSIAAFRTGGLGSFITSSTWLQHARVNTGSSWFIMYGDSGGQQAAAKRGCRECHSQHT